MQTRTYADILDRIEALAGKDSFESAEQTRLLSLVNARWYRAYRANEYWPRYITVGEERALDQTTGTVPFTAVSAVLVTGAGSEEANGTYFANANGGYTNYATGAVFYLEGGNNWVIATEGQALDLYASGALTPGDSPWDALAYTNSGGYVGVSPAPTVTESPRADIDSFMRLSSAAPYGAGTAASYEIDFYVSNAGAHPLVIPESGFTTLWVTYKAEWGGPYAASTTLVPIEFFEYIAHGAFADWLRSSGQSVPQAQAEDAIAQEMLNYELIKSQNRVNAQVNNNRFSTYISNQSRSWIGY